MIDKLVDHAVLSPGAEKRLFARLRSGGPGFGAARERARERIVRQNLRLVAKLARKFYVPAEAAYDYEDLFQAGIEGLVTAVERFDLDKGCKFSTYATWWVRQSIGRFVDNNASTIRLPVGVREDLKKGHRARAGLSAGSTGQEPTIEEVAGASGICERRLEAVEGFARVSSPVSLEAPLRSAGAAPSRDGEAPTLGRVLADEGDDTAEAALEGIGQDEILALLGPAIADLPSDQRKVLTLRFGLGDGRGSEGGSGRDPMTLEAAGAELGLSYEAVRKREQRALTLLKRALAADVLGRAA